MPGKIAGSDPRPSVRVTRGAGSGQHLASVLQKGRENANIDAGLGFIWRISDKSLSLSFFPTNRSVTWSADFELSLTIFRLTNVNHDARTPHVPRAEQTGT
jgi:hypothetical protein